jgi:hypothetical protein
MKAEPLDASALNKQHLYETRRKYSSLLVDHFGDKRSLYLWLEWREDEEIIPHVNLSDGADQKCGWRG